MKTKKLSSLFFLLMIAAGLFAQPVVVVNENFDKTSGNFTAPRGGWGVDSSLYVSGHRSMLGVVPTQPGDSVELVSGWFDCQKYSNILVQFSHICKVSVCDFATVEFQIDQLGAKWQRFPLDCYKGTRTPYRQVQFYQKSYDDWLPNDSLATPTNSWWKTEVFDLSTEISWEKVRFKFKIKRGNVVGTQFAYGWLIEDFIVYGSAAQINIPVADFLVKPADTSYVTGPFRVRAKAATRTLARLYPPKLQLVYEYNNVKTYDSIQMSRVEGDSIWEAVIPQQVFGTKITYSITARDTIGNAKTISSALVVKRYLGGGKVGYAYSGTPHPTGATYALPAWKNYAYNWNKCLYTSHELGGGGFITRIGYNVARTGPESYNQECWFKLVNDTVITDFNWKDPAQDGATMVYQGTWDPTVMGWRDIQLSNPFVVPAGKHLMMIWVNKDGATANPYMATRYQVCNDVQGIYSTTATGTGSNLTNGDGQSFKGYVRFFMAGISYQNSVSLYSIDHPTGSVIAGQATPVTVSIRNEGLKNLTSCKINWSINGTVQTPYQWKGNLPDNFIDTGITIGSYVPTAGKYDQLVVWVSDPNGVKDSALFDDTLSVRTFGCGSRFAGKYVVGSQSGADFATVTEALDKIALCGSNGNVTLQLQDGQYTSVEIPDLSKHLGNDTLFITSLSGNRNKVVFVGNGTYMISFNSAQNVVLSNISCILPKGGATQYGIQFANGCKNIEVRNCYVYMDTVETATKYCVYKASSTIACEDIRFIKNEFVGGYYGVYFYGGNGTANYSSNLVFDSNLVYGAYYYGHYFYYNHFKSISHNTFRGRSENNNNYMYHYLYYTNVDVMEGNRYDLYDFPGQYMYNYFYYVNLYNTSSRGLFINNEIIGPKNADNGGYGMYVGYSNMDIYHNTILMKSGYGIYVYNYNQGTANFMNNIIAMTAPSGTTYPMYVGSTQVAAGIGSIDYNLYYAKSNVGYWLGNRTSIDAWRSATGQDAHSLYKKPVFFNIPDFDTLANHPNLYDSAWTHKLNLALYTGMECPVPAGVTRDIEGTPRAGYSIMGCYSANPQKLDAAVTSLTGISASMVKGAVSKVSAVITNMGETTLTSAKIGWSLNGVSRADRIWSGSLATYASDTVPLDTLSSYVMENRLKVWVSAPNNGTDANVKNDTLVFNFNACDSMYHGLYTVGGKTSDFATLTDAIASITTCGVDGPVTLRMETGTYGPFSLGVVNGLSARNTLTITSATGNPADVVFQANGGYAAMLNAARYLRLVKLTFDGKQGTGGMNMAGKCQNVIVDGCVMKANTTSGNYAFYHSGSVCDSIYLLNNEFDGGYYGLYFYGSGTGTGGYNTNIHIDSNRIINADYYSHYFYYTDLTSFSHNKIIVTSRQNYHYCYFYYTNHYNTVCNSWDFTKSSVKNPYIYYYYPHRYNYGSSTDGYIINNEVVGAENGENGYCMYLGYPGETYHIWHNSFYLPSQNGYGIYGYFTTVGNNTNVELINNLIYSNYYPIYTNGNLATITSDHNNLYCPAGRIASLNGVVCTSLKDWTNETNDNTTVSVAPQFLGTEVAGLELAANTGLSCPALNGVTEDITGFTRKSPTMIGCYEFNPKKNDLNLVSVVKPEEGEVVLSGDTIPVVVCVRNIGSAAVTSLKVNWTVNGVGMTQKSWTGNLASMAIDTIYVGHFTAVSGSNHVKVWTSLPNNAADERPANDTATTSISGCSSLFQGTFTMGKGGQFKDFDDFMTTVGNCGLGGPVTLKILSGSYDCLHMDKAIKGTSYKNTITITSAAGNADSVVIYNSSGQDATVTFGDGLNHVILEKVTVKGYNNMKGTNWIAVGLYGCDSVWIRNCKIICDAPQDSYEEGSAFTNIYDPYNSWTVFSCGAVFIENNYITGPRYGMYLESNTGYDGCLHFTHNDMHFRYVVASIWAWDLADFSYNTFTVDVDSNAGVQKYIYLGEMYGKYSNLDTMRFIGNRYLVYDSKATDGTYMYFEDFHPDSCFIVANNEFIFTKGCSRTTFELYGFDNLHYINNSLYLPEGGDVYNNYHNSPVIMANNLYMAGQGTMNLDFNSNRFLYSDYNNVVGYKLSDLQRATGLDSHSVSIAPMFVDLNKSLNMLDNSGMDCPVYGLVPTDITGKKRDKLTTIGCYEVAACGNNVMPRAMVSPTLVSITGQKTPLTVTVLNAGSNTITSFKVNAKVNGTVLQPFNWSGRLASKATVNVNLGDFIPKADTNFITVWTSNPNGGVDSLPANDTLEAFTVGCDSLLGGDYIVKSNAELKAIVGKLISCGVKAPVRVLLANGSYTSPDLMDPFNGVSHKNSVTFASLSGDADSVVLTGTLNLGDVSYLRFNDLTFHYGTEYYVVYIQSMCKDIEFNRCSIIADPKVTGTGVPGCYGFYKASGFVIDSLRILNCLIDGGYYGIYCYGSNSNMLNTNIVIDSNTISNQWYYGTYFYYNEINSFSHNSILSRTTNANTYWYGFMCYYSNVPRCDGNRIHQRTTTITCPYLAYIYYNGYYGTATPTNFTNNELMGYTTSTYYGMYVGYSNVNIFQNTIRMTGSGASRCIYTAGSGYNMVIKNNILVNTASGAHPIYMGTAGNAITDNNCIYAPTYAGYSGSAMTRATWQASGFDQHSAFVNPQFVMQDSNEYLKLASYSGLFMPVLPTVTTDRQGKPRAGMTIVGAYTQEQQKVDAALAEFVNLPASSVIGQSLTAQVRLTNMGYDQSNLTSATIDWYVNGVKQNAVKWQGNLAPYASAVVQLGSFKPVAGPNKLAARVSNPNGTKDMEPENDSIVAETYGCDSILHGTYRVGGTGRYDFATINDALNALSHCGVNGPTTFLIAAGSYPEMTVGAYNGASHKNMVTFTSATGKAADVVVSGTNHLTLNAAKHVRFDRMTFGKSNGTRGVSFSGFCQDVEFYHCEILLSPTATTSGTYAVYKPSGGVLDSIRFIGNHIEGGYYGVYLYGASTSTNGYNTNMIFDSNLVENVYYYTYYFYYNDILSFCHNTFLPRKSAGSYHYCYLYYCNLDRMEGNRYNTTRNTNINYFYNYAYYINRYNNNGRRGMICNNEIIHTRTNGYGFYLGYDNTDFINNSVFATKAQYAIYGYCDGSTDLRMKNNNIVSLGGNAIQIYNVTNTNMQFESNNFYGRTGIMINSNTYSSLADMITATGDTNLTAVYPNLIDSTVSLEQADYVGISCMADPKVMTDITGIKRSIVTARGAYSMEVVEGKNLEMTQILSPRLSGTVACYPDYSTAEVEITNKGTEDIDFAKDGVRICMSSDSANVFYVDTLLSTGVLHPMQKMTVKITDFFPTSYTGFYNITAWVKSAADTVHVDDTAHTIYEVTRVVLPFETDFTVIPLEFAFDSIQGEVQWELMESAQPSLPSIKPDYGTGMLHFGSSTGRASLSRAVIKQVDLLGSTKPQISFWYAHDNSNPNAHDYVELLASTDGGATYKRLMTVYRYDASCKTPTWKMHQYDLSAFVKETCLHLAFEAGSYGGGDQNIDRIRINVEQDMAVTRFLLSDSLSACDLKGRALDVMLTNSTAYDVNYERPDSVKLHVTLTKPDSSVTNITKVLRGRLLANTIDTLRIVNSYDFDMPGTYNFRAYVDTVTFTTDVSNDTLDYSFDVLPDLAVVSIDTIPSMSSGDVVMPTVYVVNTGNLVAEKVQMRMKVNDANDILETSNFPLKPGDTLKYTFKQGFTVPEVTADQPFYFLSVESEMSCDMDATNDIYTFVGGVNLMDLSVYSIGAPKPAASGCDTGTKEIYVNINLYNYSDVMVDSATVHVIVDSANTVYAEFTELVTNVAVGNTNMSLHTAYKVPNFDGEYTVTVYVENVRGEMNNSNDTARVKACAVKYGVGVEDFDADVYQLGQNIPNPAALRTVIPFNVPQDANVRLSVMSANGQMLFSTEIRATAGANSYELDVEQLATGIYYYSMEYKGQRLVKKMNVVR